MIMDNSQGFCTKQKAEKILRFTILLYYDHKDASLESSMRKTWRMRHSLATLPYSWHQR